MHARFSSAYCLPYLFRRIYFEGKLELAWASYLWISPTVSSIICLGWTLIFLCPWNCCCCELLRTSLKYLNQLAEHKNMKWDISSKIDFLVNLDWVSCFRTAENRGLPLNFPGKLRCVCWNMLIFLFPSVKRRKCIHTFQAYILQVLYDLFFSSRGVACFVGTVICKLL